MSSAPISLNDLRSEYTEDDLKPQRREPKPGIVYEFELIDSKVEQSQKGHLNLKMEVHALDGDGRMMFKKYINVPIPVSLPEHQAPEYAKGLWLTNIKPFFPDAAPYDKVEKDAITGKKVYSKKGNVIQGAEFDKAVVEGHRKISDVAMDVAKTWVQKGNGCGIDEFPSKRFFAKVKVSKDGKYVNVDRMTSEAPENEEVCYDRNVALGGK